MNYEPRRHQRLAEEFCMTHSHAGLLLDMGLGKTVVTLTVLHRLLYDEFALNKALVIARSAWPRTHGVARRKSGITCPTCAW